MAEEDWSKLFPGDLNQVLVMTAAQGPVEEDSDEEEEEDDSMFNIQNRTRHAGNTFA